MTDVGAEPRLEWTERLSDRCSPILVREIQQALSGRLFLLTLAVAVIAVVVLALSFAQLAEHQEQPGREAFAYCIMCLAPIALLIVPMQSFASMRQEVSGGTAEQLLMTRLRPSRIVLGKTLAGLAQFVVFLGVFAPVMAMTFLLRGVDVPTILVMLAFAVIASIAANVFAIALAAVAGNRLVQQGTQAIASLALLISTMGAIGGAWELPREVPRLLTRPEGIALLLSLLALFAAGTCLFGMIATAALAHGHENRSSPFRAFAAVVMALLAPWVWAAIGTRFLDEAAAYVSASAALCLAPIWLWAVCEDERMSPRVETLVPRAPALAWLTAPFLPGGGRGVWFAIWLSALGLAAGLGLPVLAGVGIDREAGQVCLFAWLYVLIFAAMGGVIRRALPEGRRFSLIAFGASLGTILMLSILPLVVHALMSRRLHWNVAHVFNPFFTIDEIRGRAGSACVVLPIVATVGILLSLPAIRRGLREVIVASAERRRRAGAI